MMTLYHNIMVTAPWNLLCKALFNIINGPIKFSTILANERGVSVKGVWPEFGITVNFEFGIFLYSSAYDGGIILSSSPQTSSVGDIIPFNLSARSSILRIPNNVDIKAYFALGSFILLTKSLIVSSVTVCGS